MKLYQFVFQTMSLDKEQKLRQNEAQTFNTKVAGKCKAGEKMLN